MYCKNNYMYAELMFFVVSGFDFISKFRLDTNSIAATKRTRGSNQYQTAYRILPEADVSIDTRWACDVTEVVVLLLHT